MSSPPGPPDGTEILSLGAATLERLRAAIADRYVIEGELGRGGMAIVYRARDVRHGRAVAMKVLRPEIAGSVGSDRFLQEIRIEAQLQHPGIVPLFDSGVASGLPFYVMPLIEGESLRARLNREGPLPTGEAVAIVRDVGAALAHAHAQGYVHRDVKPDNILLSGGRALVTDFGIARALEQAAEQPLTESGLAAGTPAYMSPEQAGGDRRIDQRSDVYALGCVLFEILAGEPPFTGRAAHVVLARQLQEKPRLVTIDRPGVPAPVAEAIAKALEKVPADRFPTVAGFLEALERHVPPRGRSRWRPAAAVGIALAALVIWVWSTREGPPPDANKIVVFPLAERGLGVSDSGAGYDAALMLTQAFEHVEPLRWIDVRLRLRERGVVEPAGLSAGQARAITLDRGARYYITGVAWQARDSAAITLQLHDAAADSQVTQASALGSRGQHTFASLALDAALGILPALLGPGRRFDLSALTERDRGALALWMQGERAYRNSRFSEAIGFYERAHDRDSALALAALSGAGAAVWLNDVTRAAALLDAALGAAALLPERHVRYARGLRAYVRGHGDSAVGYLEQALAMEPQWPEALMALAEVHYHLIPAADVAPLPAAIAGFEAALRADSGFAPPLVHLAEAAVRRGDGPAAGALVRRLEAHEPDPYLVSHLGLMLDCLEHGQPRRGWQVEARLRPLDVFTAAAALAPGGAQPRCARDALAAILGSGAVVGQKWGAFLILHGILAAEGRQAELVSLVDSVARAATPMARALYVLDALAGLPVDSHAREVAHFVQSIRGAGYETLQDPFTLWLMGHWHAKSGDTALAEALADRLTAMQAGDRSAPGAGYALGLRARVRILRGDTTAALAHLRGLIPRAPAIVLAWGLGDAHAPDRLLFSQLLLATGSHREALDVAAGFDHPGPAAFLPFVPASLGIRLRAALALGESAEAERYRDRLSRLGRKDLIEEAEVSVHPRR
jgi:tetratricopeptide (TPR) repeat protein